MARGRKGRVILDEFAGFDEATDADAELSVLDDVRLMGGGRRYREQMEREMKTYPAGLVKFRQPWRPSPQLLKTAKSASCR